MSFRGTEVSWRSLWRLVEGTEAGTPKWSYISLDNGPERYAFKIMPGTPVAQLADVYWATLDKCDDMSDNMFVTYYDKMLAQREALEQRDADKAEAFFAALADNRKRREARELGVLNRDMYYLFEETETNEVGPKEKP